MITKPFISRSIHSPQQLVSMASQGRIPFQALEKSISREPKKQFEASLEALNNIREFPESPFQKNTSPSVEGGKSEYAKEMQGKHIETSFQGSDELMELAEDPFKKFAHPSTDKVQPRFLKDLWKKQTEFGSEGSNDVMEFMEDPVQKYVCPLDEKAQSGYHKDSWTSSPLYQHPLTFGPSTGLAKRKESKLSSSSPFTSKIKTSFQYKCTSINGREPKVSKIFTSREQPHLVKSGTGDMEKKGSASSASRSTGSNVSLETDLPYKRSCAELGDSGARKAARSNRWVTPSGNSEESHTRSSWNCDSMVAGGSLNIMTSIEYADPSSNADSMRDPGFHDRPPIVYLDEPEFPADGMSFIIRSHQSTSKRISAELLATCLQHVEAMSGSIRFVKIWFFSYFHIFSYFVQ